MSLGLSFRPSSVLPALLLGSMLPQYKLCPLLRYVCMCVKKIFRPLLSSDGPFALRKVEARLYGVLKSEFQTHEVGIVPNF